MQLAVIADEITAIGWRLAGAQVHLAGSTSVADSLQKALRSADLILITAQLAAQVPSAQLDQALHALAPLLLVIPDVQQRSEPADLEREVRRALGVGE
jgi:vacuolar-type H+-ATPase subunit F/Vma7